MRIPAVPVLPLPNNLQKDNASGEARKNSSLISRKPLSDDRLSTKRRNQSMIKKITVLTITVAFSMSLYAAIDDKEYTHCAVIKNDVARLDCFDNLAKSKALDGRQAEATPIVGKRNWKVTVDINPIDGSKIVILSLNAISAENRRIKPVQLVARCKSNTTDLYINWNEYLGNEAEVLIRVGDHKPNTERWSISTDKKTTFHTKPIPLLKEMLTSSKMVSQVTPHNENPLTAIFNTSGLKNAIKPLQETCNWKYLPSDS